MTFLSGFFRALLVLFPVIEASENDIGRHGFQHAGIDRIELCQIFSQTFGFLC